MLRRRHFADGYFELGSGTCLQPLLRFTDRFSDFLFVDFEPSGRAAQRALEAAFVHLRRAAGGRAPPLALDGVDLQTNLGFADFELAMAPAEVPGRLAEALRPEDVRSLDGFRRQVSRRRPAQWGLSARIRRVFPRVGGARHERQLTLRLFGGEGLMTYIGMGGLEAPPAYVSTVQTGLGEAGQGPLAHLFTAQRAAGRPLPEVWIRGRAPAPGAASPVRAPVGPFRRLAQAYAGWFADRPWPGAPSTKREVWAWTLEPATPSRPKPLRVGPHRIVPRPLESPDMEDFDAFCVPERLGEQLGMTAFERARIVPRLPPRTLHPPLAVSLERWSETAAFRSAARAALVPSGFEDESAVLVDWLRQVSGPAVTVFLPMPLDFGAARRAVEEAGREGRSCRCA